MGHTLHGIYESGGGCMCYVWHVLGYPWAVCTHPGFPALLDLTGVDAHDIPIKYVMQKIFGPAHWTVNGSEYYPAYTCPVFPTLLWDSMGSEEWTLDQSKGILDSSGWSVEVLCDEVAWDWPHKAEGDEIYGLEGLQRVIELDESLTAGWGSITESLMRLSVDATRPETFGILEDSGGRLFSRIDALGANDHMVLWCEHEAIAVVSATTPVVNEFRAFIADDGEGRGLYGSRIADHLYRPTIGCIPVISDVPLGIAGEYCELWQIPLDENGDFVMSPLDENGVEWPIVAKQRGGVVSTNIRTNANKTSIDILPWTDALKVDVDKREFSQNFEAHLKRYVLCRGVNSGDDKASITEYQQCPHLVIMERYVDEDGNNKNNLYPVWLCGPGEIAIFDTFEDIINALNKKITEAYLVGNLRYSHVCYMPVGNKEVACFQQLDGVISAVTSFKDGKPIGPIDPDYVTLITGPLAFILGLGLPNTTFDEGMSTYSHLSTIDTGFRSEYNTDISSFFFKLEYCNTKMWEEINGNIWHKAWPIVLNTGRTTDLNDYLLTPLKRSSYYYQPDWINNGAGSINGTDPSPEYMRTDVVYNIPHDGTSDPVLYLNDGSSIGINESISVGDELVGVVDTITDNDNDFEIELDGDMLSHKEAFIFGRSLFFLPYLESESLDDLIREDNDGNVKWKSVDNFYDPYTIKKYTEINTRNISDIFKALLGEEVTTSHIAPELQNSHFPWVDIYAEGLTSWIEWTSMDDALVPYEFHAYSYALNTEDSLYDVLKAEILLHCAQMTMDWDYDRLQWRCHFRPIEPLNKSDAFMEGRNLTAGENLSEVPAITHNASQIVNKFILKTRYGEVNLIGDRTASVKIQNREITIKPSISIFGADPTVGLSTGNMEDLAERFRNTLRHLSRVRVAQSRGLTCAGTFKAILGRESLITDAAATNPLTNKLGLDRQPVLIIARAHDLSKETIDITYSIGGKTGFGWAPACKVLTGNHEVLSGSAWKLFPETHEYTDTIGQARDLYYFDCFDTRIPTAPSPRTTCSCDDYAVRAVECWTRGFTPLPFTCRLEYEESGTPYLLLTGTTSGIDEDKNYVIYFADYDDCQPCQRFWIFGADADNTIGEDEGLPSRWV